MCLEGRTAALLLALSSIVASACGGEHPTLVAHPVVETPPLPAPTSRTSAGTPSRDATSSQAGARISGMLATTDRRRLTSGALVMTPEDSDGSAASVSATMLPDGSFVFGNVPPGTYLIRALAQTEPNAPPQFAIFRVTVRGSDIEHVDLTLLPGATISGRLVVDPTRSSAAVAFAGVRVRAPLIDGNRFGDALTGDVRRDGSFTLHGVMAGTHLIVVEELPPPWSVKSVTYRGQDITDIGLQADSRQHFEAVRITVTDVASDVSGTVRGTEGRATPGALVLFVPVPQRLWPLASRRFARVRADATGRYRVRGLPDGDYRVAASLDLDDRDTYRVDVIRAINEQGVAVSVEGPVSRVVDLPLAAISSPRRSAAR